MRPPSDASSNCQVKKEELNRNVKQLKDIPPTDKYI